MRLQMCWAWSPMGEWLETANQSRPCAWWAWLRRRTAGRYPRPAWGLDQAESRTAGAPAPASARPDGDRRVLGLPGGPWRSRAGRQGVEELRERGCGSPTCGVSLLEPPPRGYLSLQGLLGFAAGSLSAFASAPHLALNLHLGGKFCQED